MTERFGLPTAIDNDGNAAAIAEWKIGAGRGANNLVLLTLGTGIGGGLILDGRPFRGATGAGAELGHMVRPVRRPQMCLRWDRPFRDCRFGSGGRQGGQGVAGGGLRRR